MTTTGSVNVPAESLLGRFPELSLDRFELPSLPTATGVLPSAQQAFVAQAHPEGRVTFIHLDSGQSSTVTGFELASQAVEK